MTTTIIIPTFNEAENIAKLLREIVVAAPGVHVLVVDDSSIDGTPEIVHRFTLENPHIHLLARPNKTGLGDAYRAGFAWAIEREYEAVVQMDADGSHRVADLVTLLEGAKSYDVVIGSRWVRGGKISNWPMKRYLLSKLGNIYGRLMLRLSIKDATAGFRVYSRRALENAQILNSTSQGYVFQLENSVRVSEAKLSVQEIPITFVEREFGESKMNASIVSEAMLKVTFWGLQGRILGRNLFIK
jgi:dolichol-phosphate mannosyltransferase